MPEVVLNKNTGMFVELSKVTKDYVSFYSNCFNNNIAIYQILAYPFDTSTAAYIVEFEFEVQPNGLFANPKIKYYKPLKLSEKADITKNNVGVMTTAVVCEVISQKAVHMYDVNKLLQSAQVRVMSAVNPQLLSAMVG